MPVIITPDLIEPMRILIIEDNSGDARLLWEELKSSGSNVRFTPVWASRLSEGLAQLEAGVFNAVLLDLSLPDSQDLETLQRVQQQAPTMPIVVLTGLDDESRAIAALHGGAQDYLVKGSASGEMIQHAVRYAIERKRVELDLARRAKELEALFETGLEMTSQVSLHALLRSVVERAARLLDAPMGGLYLLQPDGQNLHLEYSWNLPEVMQGIPLPVGHGAAGRAVMNGAPVAVEDYMTWEGREPSFPSDVFHRTLAVPLYVGSEVIGAIDIVDDQRSGVFSPDEIRLASMFAAQAAIAIQNARLYEQVQRLATLDELTGLYNRRGFYLLAEQIFRMAHRANGDLVLFFIDIDHMKQINDQLGHQAGDQALVDAATVLRGTFRVTDVIARMGGDEFAVLAYPSAETNTQQLANRLQAEVSRFNTWTNRPFKLSLSAGCAAWIPGQTLTLENLMAQADQAMYVTKRSHTDAI
jgi:diguanylate cyclase (GGDEF)-like protein